MVLIAIRPDNMYVCSHIESLVLAGQTLRVHVLDPALGETRFLNQKRHRHLSRRRCAPTHGPYSVPPEERKADVSKGIRSWPIQPFLAQVHSSAERAVRGPRDRAQPQGHGTAATPRGSRSPLSPSQRTCQPDMV